MKKVQLIVGMTAIIPAVVATGVTAPTAAQAAQVHQAAAPTTSVTGKRVVLDRRERAVADGPRWAEVLGSPKTVYFRSGPTRTYYGGLSVYVTCYYPGAPYRGDRYWDHFTWLRQPLISSPITGHVADVFVNFSGRLPTSAGIPRCG
jgi:hypothetical protein